MTIDAVEYHLGDTADTEDDAAWHIGVFLQWCARNGMLAPGHAAAEAIADPARFLITKCNGRLERDDLTAEGNRFATHVYDRYLAALGDLADRHDLHDYLDERYDALRRGHRVGNRAAEPPVTAGEQLARIPEVTPVEVGPQRVQEDQLRIRRLPQQEV
jgi:hypothetical protein